MTWQFSPEEKRLTLRLPEELGGRTYDVCLHGGYTFAPVPAAVV